MEVLIVIVLTNGRLCAAECLYVVSDCGRRCEFNLFTLFFVAELMMNGVLDFFLRLRFSCAQWGQGILSCRH